MPQEKKVANKIEKKKETTTVKKIDKTKKTLIEKSIKIKKETTKKVSTSLDKTKKKTKKATSTKTNSKTKINKVENSNSFLEYYDLPYRYNETIVKSLFQKPKTLFVYWDISDSDKQKYIEKYGQDFFETTTPVLKITNTTKNYYFEIIINDFANSWYFDVKDANCEYIIELGRYINNKNKYIKIYSSKEIQMPNDHVLFETFQEKICFKNIKTNEIFYKNFDVLKSLKCLKKDLNIENIYNMIYKDEQILDLNNPSSNNPTSTF